MKTVMKMLSCFLYTQQKKFNHVVFNAYHSHSYYCPKLHTNEVDEMMYIDQSHLFKHIFSTNLMKFYAISTTRMMCIENDVLLQFIL